MIYPQAVSAALEVVNSGRAHGEMERLLRRNGVNRVKKRPHLKRLGKVMCPIGRLVSLSNGRETVTTNRGTS